MCANAKIQNRKDLSSEIQIEIVLDKMFTFTRRIVGPNTAAVIFYSISSFGGVGDGKSRFAE